MKPYVVPGFVPVTIGIQGSGRFISSDCVEVEFNSDDSWLSVHQSPNEAMDTSCFPKLVKQKPLASHNCGSDIFLLEIGGTSVS